MAPTRKQSKKKEEDALPPPAEGTTAARGRKKKRRRDGEDEDEEVVQKRKRRKSEVVDEEEEDGSDEEMEEQIVGSDDEDMEEKLADDAGNDAGGKDKDQKKPAASSTTIPPVQANGNHAAPSEASKNNNGSSVTAAKPPAMRAPAVDRLKLPSKRTPGNLRETAPLARDSDPGVTRLSRRLVLDASNDEEEDEHKDNGQENGDAAEPQAQVSLMDRVMDVVEDLKERGLQIVASFGTQKEDALDDATQPEAPKGESSTALLRPLVWFFLLLLFQAVFYPIWINPILSSVVDASKVAAVVYKGILVPSRAQPSNDTVMTLQPNVTEGSTDEPEEDDEKDEAEEARLQEQLTVVLRDKVKEIGKWKDQLVKSRETLDEEAAGVARDASLLKQALARRQEVVGKSAASISETLGSLESLLAMDQIDPSALALVVRELLGPAQVVLADTSSVKLWEAASMDGCSKAASKKAVIEWLRAFEGRVAETTRTTINDSEVKETVAKWIRQGAPELPNVSLETSQPALATPSTSSLGIMHSLINSRLEQERADLTGLVDYASLLNGASVIRTGERATSPSLVDGLPVLNRLMALLSLRFYGHGPEAAITPTTPPTALGQCWSFQKDESSRHSAFATFSVNLAEKIYVDSISIEHPPKELTDQPDSAIRAFRVYGFEDPGASGKAYSLGSFEYRRGGEMRQEFEVNENEPSGEIPPLQSISLAIDSTWSAEYACLYRLRVHGDYE